MKFHIAALLPLAVGAFSPTLIASNVKHIPKRQTPSSADGLSILFQSTFESFPKLEAIRIETLKPQLRSDAKRMRISWGPVTAYAAGDVRKGYKNLFPSTDGDNPTDTGFAHIIASIPTDITMLWAKVDLNNKDGQSMSSDDKGIYLHHLFFYQINSDKIRKEFCFGSHKNWVGAIGRRTPEIMLGGGSGDHAGGEYFITEDPNFNSGYYLPKDARFLAQGEVINTNNATQYLYPSLELEYIPGKPKYLKDVSMMMFSVTNCLVESPTIAFLSPPGKVRFDKTSDKFPLPEDGYIINAVGHMHDGGERIEARLNGKLICNSVATYGRKENYTMPMPMNMGKGKGTTMMRRHGPAMGPETIVQMSDCRDIIPVKKGDIVELKGYYDLEAHGGRVANGESLGQMGIYVMYFASNAEDAKMSWSLWK